MTLPTQKRVLIVDDDRVTRTIVRKILERAGYAVFESESMADGLRDGEKILPHMILLDWMVGGKTGADFLESKKNIPVLSAIPVIAVSGRTSPFGKSQVLSLGVAGFVGKPVDARILIQKIAMCLKDWTSSAA